MNRIEGTLKRVGMLERADDRVKTYSQGMRQRLGVARCLLADPELLILDEPMNGLDPGGILEFREMIAALVAEGRTVFLSSHLLDEVEKTCQMAAVIDQGRLIASGPISELISGGASELDIGCDNPRFAMDLLDGVAAVSTVREIADGVRVTLAGTDGAAGINAKLVSAGVGVFRLEPVRESLEHRFLEITSRVGDER
jgi:ABC-2 type transport system ATP-binding protein